MKTIAKKIGITLAVSAISFSIFALPAVAGGKNRHQREIEKTQIASTPSGYHEDIREYSHKSFYDYSRKHHGPDRPDQHYDRYVNKHKPNQKDRFERNHNSECRKRHRHNRRCNDRYQHDRYSKKRGHWEYEKVWVPAKYKKVWNPGHYNKRNRWIPGKWISMEKRPGYWKKERVWVSHQHRPRRASRM